MKNDWNVKVESFTGYPQVEDKDTKEIKTIVVSVKRIMLEAKPEAKVQEPRKQRFVLTKRGEYSHSYKKEEEKPWWDKSPERESQKWTKGKNYSFGELYIELCRMLGTEDAENVMMDVASMIAA